MHNDRWAELTGQVDPRSPVIEDGLSRKLITYDKWFAAPLDDTGKPQIPQYLRNQNIPTDVVRSVARFRTSSHYLKVETDRWGSPPRPWADRICTLCDLSGVQDEMHVLCECSDEVLASFRNSLSEKSLDPSDFRALLKSGNVSELCLYIHVCMKRIDSLFLSSRRAAL